MYLIDVVFVQNFTSLEDTVFCGVFDGHGPHGHFVSRHVRETLPAVLQSCWYSYNEGSKSFVSSGDDSEDGSLSPKLFRQESMDLISAWKDCFVKAYEIMDYGLSISKSIDCLSSGTTAVSMVKLVIAIITYFVIIFNRYWGKITKYLYIYENTPM